MTPSARVQAAIELIEEIEAAARAAGSSANEITRRFFRKRRYAGSADRRAITEMAYDAVRMKAGDEWRLETIGGTAAPRLRIALRLADKGESWRHVFTAGGPYAPPPLTAQEEAAVEAARGVDLRTMPLAVRFGFPEFLTAALLARFGDYPELEMQALSTRAPLDLRVNILRSNIRKASEALSNEGINITNLPWSPIGLRADPKSAIRTTAVYRRGWVEVQDEGAQVASLLCAAGPGMQVVDLCAGAGGKTLALAAQMGNRGQIHAFDPDVRHLAELKKRLQRAHVRNVQTAVPDETGNRLSALRGCADIVLVDAPCSGSGTWRRHPELPWRLTSERLKRFAEVQSDLLDQAAGLVKAGGRIVYVTCSILPMENEDVVNRFLNHHEGWYILPYNRIWPTVADTPIPPTLSRDDRFMQLTPATHGTDGFFVAVLACRA